jgi:exosome complex component CSL4
VDLIPFRSRNFEFVVSGLSAVLRVANIDRKYVKSLRDEIRIGDIVRVKVMEVTSHTIRLTTAERDLGVIKAFCSSCRHDLEKQGTKLVCRNCGSVESRKTASDYGSGKLI